MQTKLRLNDRIFHRITLLTTIYSCTIITVWGQLAKTDQQIDTITIYQTSTFKLKSRLIPEQVFAMKNLRALSIHGMDCDYGDTTTCWMIWEIPAQIANLQELEAIHLSINAIRTIPKEITELKKLKKLDLTDNAGLSDIDNITGLTTLEELYLFGCSLDKLPEDIGKLKKLKHLGLTGNNINTTELERIKKALPNCNVIFENWQIGDFDALKIVGMNYQTFPPHSDLQSVVKCYWTLEVPAENNSERQRIIPDGCIEMAFILGDDIKRFTTGDNFILQPRAMVLGQTIEPFYIQPTGYVNTFAIRFYPYGFANFVDSPIKDLANKETPIGELFGEASANELEWRIIQATDTRERIEIVEGFLLTILKEQSTIDNIVKTTIDALLSTNGSSSISAILKEDTSKRRQLERKFLKQIGISPKQLGKVIRLQAALRMLLNPNPENLTSIAYESQYYDQAHFIKDFKEFTGTNPKDFLKDGQMALSTLFYAGN